MAAINSHVEAGADKAWKWL